MQKMQGKQEKQEVPEEQAQVPLKLMDPIESLNEIIPIERYPIQESLLIRYKIEEEIYFNKEQAIMVLMNEGVLYINSAPDGIATFYLNCGETFYLDMEDIEQIPLNEIENLYNMWIRDSGWGPTVWCIQYRKQKPLKLFYDIIQSEGIWNLNEMGL